MAPRILAVLLALALAGCTGPAPAPEAVPEPEPIGATSAHEASRAAALAWREDALLVGMYGQERANGTPNPRGIGPENPVDLAMGDGIAAIWLVAYRSPAQQEFQVFAVHENGTVAALERSNEHPLAAKQTTISVWRVDSAAAIATAKTDPAFLAAANGSKASISMQLHPPNPSYGFQEATKPLALNAHWAMFAWNQTVGMQTIYVDAMSGRIVPVTGDPEPSGDDQEVPVHLHAAFHLYINGTRMRFNHEDYDVGSTRFSDAHLRAAQSNGDAIIHVEGVFPSGEPDVTLAQFTASLGLQFRPSLMVIEARGENESQFIPDGNGSAWFVYQAPEGQPFERVHGDYTDLQFAAGQRILITYGSLELLSDAELARQQNGIPRPA